MAGLLLGPAGGTQARPDRGVALHSTGADLDVSATAPGRYGVSVRLTADPATTAFRQAAPLAIDVVDSHGGSAWLTGGYQTVTGHAAGELTCIGTLKSPGGTQFRFTDIYRAVPRASAFTLARTVRVASPNANDAGFNSQFSLTPGAPTAMADDDFFAPGIWYKDNAHVPPTALASHRDDRYYYFREDRLPLPVVMIRDRRSGTTLALAHLGGAATTFAGEDGLDRITDARMQFGALGILNTARPSPVFLFPGTEGERTYTYGGSTRGDRWAYRSHPVRPGVLHAYRLLIQLGRTPDFPAAVRRTWRTAYALARPPILKADLAKVYQDSMDLLASYIRPYHGVISVPFEAAVPDGRVYDTSSEMGFVGQALPCAALLLRDGLERGNADAAAHAAQVVDFWADHAMTPVGLPRGWYDIHPDGTFTWRSYHLFLRIASDGLDGALRAWSLMRRRGQDRPRWLTFCRRYGDWLVQAQNPDGSWAREYDAEGHPVNPATDTTDQPIPFLVDLSLATGDSRYRAAALRAGEFCWKSVHQAYAYVGGTPDNPNVMDKEGGLEALAAFLALYDASRSRRWLAAATQAATYSETWVYCWNIPMPPGDPAIIFPRGRTTVGLSLIATGHSGSDNSMAGAPFLFYRLSLLTGDAHFRRVARMLLLDTKQMLDWDGTLGYRYPGLLTEALSLPPPRGHGVRSWLPWLTAAVLEPMVDLRQTFGGFDIAEIERLPRAERVRREALFSRYRGLGAPPSVP